MIASAPYVDTKGRFQLELPEGWRLLPAYGDSFGMRFQRELPGGRVSLTVHVDPVEVEGLESFVTEIEGWVLEQGLERKTRDRGRVGSYSAVVLSFDSGKQKDARSKVAARSYFLEERAHYYHLHVSASPAFVLDRARREVDALLHSFVAAPKPTERASASPPVVTPKISIVGDWLSDKGVRFRLDPDGRFAMGGAEGRYLHQGETLALMIEGKSPQSFRAELTEDRLLLHSERLPAPAVYRRATASRAVEPALTGRWRATIPGGTLELALDPTGRFSLESHRGQWVLRDGLLSLTTDEGEVIAYAAEIEGERLALSGGDLEEPLWLHKISAE